jgi:hypothetical protein
LREALAARGTETCIPPIKSRKKPLHDDTSLYRQGHKIENVSAKLKDWRRMSPATTDAPARLLRPSASQQPLLSTQPMSAELKSARVDLAIIRGNPWIPPDKACCRAGMKMCRFDAKQVT